ncbi:MAG: nucleotide pyrophosphohydrolase [Betaproteobacteria bacterium]|nr:nucleotide pyrophosphohydrolase [Betaproteobacteria bacterium]
MPSPDPLQQLRDALRVLVDERDWDQFHAPKSLAMSVMIEAAELGEHFQWLGTGDSAELPADERDEVALEIADVLLYLVRLADKLDIDMIDAARRKLVLNARKYPVEKARGRSTKYTEL